jgi:hypothetical protein
MKAPLINVGCSAAQVQEWARLVETIFRAGFESHVEQETIRVALTEAAKALKVEYVTISSNTFTGIKGLKSR